ncbi:hypothetical protein H4R34_003101 [Dimargaris verticillata]|uniref:Uncharacterized protein n=1 Tax=Dimargaris verticillata TaxID=2761393 RepID=A0A9W8ECB3_9FUNG|nr:hypothetical protein H4R34_003101 [Dimargaris verticillata]
MFPTSLRMAVVQPHKHVPLIKFLGPRRLLQQQDHGTPTTAATSSSQASTTASSTAGVIEFANLPARYKSPGLTEEEMEAIEAPL